MLQLLHVCNMFVKADKLDASMSLSLYASKFAYYAFWHFPNFFHIMLVFMLFRNALCFYFV